MRPRYVLSASLYAVCLLTALAGVCTAEVLPQILQVTIDLRSVAGSGAEGTATLWEKGNVTTVGVRVRGFEPNTWHATFVHAGTCPADGQSPSTTPVKFDSDDNLAARANLYGEISGWASRIGPASSLMDGNHFIATHAGSGSSPGPMVACGNIPRLSAGTHLPATGNPGLASIPALIMLGLALVCGGLLLRASLRRVR